MAIYQSPTDSQGFGVEVHTAPGLPSFDILGAPSERVRFIRSHLVEMLGANCQTLPTCRVTVNVLGPTRPNLAIAQAIYDGINTLHTAAEVAP